MLKKEGVLLNENSILELETVSVEFPGVLAVDNVNLNIKKGEIRSIVGENGAGKSTLMKVLSGVHSKKDYTGVVKLDGKEINFNNVSDAERNGITMIPQELNLVEELSVAENLFLNLLPGSYGIVDKYSLYKKAEKIMNEVGLNMSPSVKVSELGVAQKQMIVIGRALLLNVKVLILDEPTSTLSNLESEILFNKIKEFKRKGITCLYISHRLEEVLNICDSVTVMRDGKVIETITTKGLTEQKIVSLMIGKELEQFYPDSVRTQGDVKFEVDKFSVYDTKFLDRKVVDDVSLKVHTGEILGLFGLVGAGRTELAKGIIGAWEGLVQGKIIKDGKEVNISNSWEAISEGIGYLPEDRISQAIIPERSVSDNISVSSVSKISNFGVIDRKKELTKNQQFVTELSIKTASLATKIKNLSGGNQQKAILARLLSVNSDVLILDEPTQGVDVGAKTEIYNLLNELTKQKKAVILISSDLEEVLGMSDRIIVMRQGKIVGTFIAEDTNRYEILEYATLGSNNRRSNNV